MVKVLRFIMCNEDCNAFIDFRCMDMFLEFKLMEI